MFPLSIHPFAHRCCRRLHFSRLLTISQAITLTFFFKLLMKSSQNLPQPRLCEADGEDRERDKRGEGAIERKKDSMCLCEWRWRVSVWLVNPV